MVGGEGRSGLEGRARRLCARHVLLLELGVLRHACPEGCIGRRERRAHLRLQGGTGAAGVLRRIRRRREGGRHDRERQGADQKHPFGHLTHPLGERDSFSQSQDAPKCKVAATNV